VDGLSDLPMLHDMDADYSPQYVKLARVLREKIQSGELSRFMSLPASHLATEYRVSTRVAYAALEMLAANRYIGRPNGARSYRVTWDAVHPAPSGRLADGALVRVPRWRNLST
jgi:DNA-binding transcriptional MocR family regulator